ncbi:MAG: AI-2E family transporter [Candidatus Magnetoovum sp. WYHC-5]|nr:AI-2E family transporter [Candidatus Magnetoovum sp. WYHC-5]
MSLNKAQSFILIVFLTIFAYLTYNVIEPFLRAVLWAIVFGIVFYPLYIFFKKWLKVEAIASILTLIIIVFIIVGPFSYVVVNLISEIKIFLKQIEASNLEKIRHLIEHPTVKTLILKIEETFNVEIDITGFLMQNISNFGNTLASKATHGLKNIFLIVFDFIFMIFTLYFFFLDGPKFITKLKGYLPMTEKQKDRLVKVVQDMVISTIYGGIVVSLVQGFLSGVVFYSIGLRSPVLLGTAASVMSFIPVMGAFSVWGTVDVLLFLNGSYIKGFILLFAGAFGISLVDNILKPIIISGRTKMPILIVFICVIGGIKLFGLIGLVMGPLAIVLFVSFFEIFLREETDEEVVQNEPLEVNKE